MEFTFWETKSVKLPRGPLYSVFGFLLAIAAIAVLGQWAGSLVQKKEVKFSGATLPELQAWEQTLAGGDPAKLEAMMQKDGSRIGADMAKWVLVSKWKSDVLLGLYKDDLLFDLRQQIDSLKKQLEAEKLKAAGGGKVPAAGGGSAPAPAAPTKQ